MVKEIKTLEERKQKLIEKGLEQGFITYEQLAEELKGLEVDSEALDELYNAFMENNIDVVSDNEEEDPDEDPASMKVEDLTFTKDIKINDPVRMYLK